MALRAFLRGEDSIDAQAGAMLVASWGDYITALGRSWGVKEAVPLPDPEDQADG